MSTKLEAEKNDSSNCPLTMIKGEYEEFMERMEEIVHDQQQEIEHFGAMREKAGQCGQILAALHYSKNYMEIYEKTMNNIDTLELAGKMKESVIFLMTGAVPSFIYVGRKKKVELLRAKDDLKMIYG